MAQFKAKILVVDDDPEARGGLARALGANGYDVIEVGTGAEALSHAKSDWPALIILDVVLPNMPGTEVLERLRADPITRAIPVLLLTGKPEIVEKRFPSYSQSDRIFKKPSSLEELLKTVQRMLTGQ